MTSICNEEQGCFGVMSGHDRKTLRLSDQFPATQQTVVRHPHVVAEVAGGTPPDRRAIVGMPAELESVPVATPEELLWQPIERHPLYGRGCGSVDVSPMASALLGEQTLHWNIGQPTRAGCRRSGPVRPRGPSVLNHAPVKWRTGLGGIDCCAYSAQEKGRPKAAFLS